MDCTDEQSLGESSHKFHYRLYNNPRKFKPFEETAPFSMPTGSIISRLLKTASSTSHVQEGGAIEQPFEDINTEGDGSAAASPGNSPDHPSSPIGKRRQLDMENLYREYMRVKRARIESIIRSMGSSPAQDLNMTSGESGAHSCSTERGWSAVDRSEVKTTQENPKPKIKKEGRQHEKRELKTQLDNMREQLLQLQEKVYHLYNGALDDDEDSDETIREQSAQTEESSIGRAPSPYIGMDLNRETAYQGSKFKDLLTAGDVEKEYEHPWVSMEGQKLADALKEELSTVVAQVIDTVVKMFSPYHQHQARFEPQHGPIMSAPAFQSPHQNHLHHSHMVPVNDRQDPCAEHQSFPCLESDLPSGRENAADPLMECRNRDFMFDQVEALPLVVRKSMDSHGPISRGHHQTSKDSILGSPFQHPLPIPLVHYTMQRMFASATAASAARGIPPCKDRMSPDAYLEMTSLSTQLSSHHSSQQHPYPSMHLLSTLDGMSPGMPKMKPDTSGFQESGEPSLYLTSSASQEGLSPSHLKKAKLMFFYTRYPSSNTLKIYFPDVKFNRCITSQLIKWFSNFREFFYIQMEKFARQAISEGVTSPEKLSINRESELFRVLNLHYNKSNDFEVPDRFLEVSQVTLREFFSAIHGNKDSDPSWKKAIYKVICKLDSEVPEFFKSPNCLQDLSRE
ncbi:prospero homeobox protein 1-like [Polypterus senegalus]|uniref:prospero homeobox protein 1-like n=1 Tax=Polypterus senegalus TaxID=55291 RepID=UPI0019662FB7|nr:prospero homeobox protein 1-like [Polypterus senegalus]